MGKKFLGVEKIYYIQYINKENSWVYVASKRKILSRSVRRNCAAVKIPREFSFSPLCK